MQWLVKHMAVLPVMVLLVVVVELAVVPGEAELCSTSNALSDLEQLLQVPTAVRPNLNSTSRKHGGGSGQHPGTKTMPPSSAQDDGCHPGHLYVWIDPLCPDGKRVWDEAKTAHKLLRNASLSFHLFPLPFHTLSYEVLRIFHRLPPHGKDGEERRRLFVDAVLENLGQFSAQVLNHRKLRDVYFDLLQLDEHGGNLQPMEEADALARKHAKAASALGIFASPQFLFSPRGCGGATDMGTALRLPPASVTSIREALLHQQ